MRYKYISKTSHCFPYVIYTYIKTYIKPYKPRVSTNCKKSSHSHCFPLLIYTKLKMPTNPYFIRKIRISYFATLSPHKGI
nr:MAG TPA: hypothetical protein [Caudoviricetes sp.]